VSATTSQFLSKNIYKQFVIISVCIPIIYYIYKPHLPGLSRDCSLLYDSTAEYSDIRRDPDESTTKSQKCSHCCFYI